MAVSLVGGRDKMAGACTREAVKTDEAREWKKDARDGDGWRGEWRASGLVGSAGEGRGGTGGGGCS